MIVYFEIYGKKMKAVVDAKTKNEAKEIIRSKIIFHKIETKISANDEDLFKKFSEIFGL